MKIVFENDQEVADLIYDALCNGLGSLSDCGIQIDIAAETYYSHKESGDCIEDVYKRILEKGGKLTFTDVDDVHDSSFTLKGAREILENIIKFQEALIQLYETEREGTSKFNLFRDSYKSQIESLKAEYENL